MTGLGSPPRGTPPDFIQNPSAKWKLGLHAPSLNALPREPGAHFNTETAPCGANSEENGWHIPDAVAYELVGLFFDYIQNWLPILHRPLFYQKYVRVESHYGRVVGRQSVSDHDAILINCVFALAARFSKASFFCSTDPVLRGEAFAERAAAIKDPIIKVIEEPSLEFVKGCALLAFYNICAGHAAPGSLLVSVCVRFAYDLGLNEIDEEDQTNCGTEDGQDAWIQKEELRRLWWVIYELDCFVSTVSCQPYGIERGEIKVLLPVSDHHWFSGCPAGSSYLIQSPGTVWKSLEGSENQSPRAWYLVTNYLKSCFADTARQPKRNTPETQTALEMDLACLKHALPADFQLRSVNMAEHNFGDCNWIISTHFMILSCEALLERRRWSQNRSETSFNTGQEATIWGRHFYSSLVRIALIWPPEYIPLNHPFMGCCVINPWDALEARREPNFQSFELSKLLLSHYSRYWKIGGALLRLLAIIHEGRDSVVHRPGSREREIIKRFSVLCPSSPKGRHSVVSRLSARVTYDTSDVPVEALPDSYLTSSGSPDELQWPLNLWDNLHAFDMDRSDAEMLIIPSSHVAEGVSGQAETLASSQMCVPAFSLSLDRFPDEFVVL
ncbi:uncharacterized protein A1O5_11598 [Cladophialophora psammophila CBS 110553]|uniref:Xylanolytic transcriptional activator regulatory domain-containing protein n=1 Tax=Cladophialophora psammophila CBS 110553 TaxID=1182543 RepID=W9W5D0_9EURO|nr:uncharacterized protein A1O5_11598 [Cladophialophora psammophila CBS 110553]EXJ63277.1 hypothetical protein A1O5_11598 [Cladophialophora psammophila CBS 110553]